MRYQVGHEPAQLSVLNQLAAGRPVLSLGVRNARTGDVARMASGAGYQVIWIDLEHSSMSIDCAAQLAATSFEGSVHLWDTSPAAARAAICANLGQPLTPAEWSSYVPGLPYRAPCS